MSFNSDNYLTYLNIYAGLAEADLADVAERGQITPPPAGFDTIEYVVDVHARKDALAAMIQGVELRFAQGSFADDYTLVDGAEDPITYQSGAGQSFNFNRGLECLGRMPCELRGKFEGTVDTGADALDVGTSALYVDSNGDAIADAPCVAQFGSLAGDAAGGNPDGYNVDNRAASALNKCLSSQMPGTGDDENLLRLMINGSDYRNLSKLGLEGADNGSGGISRFGNLASSVSSAAGFGMSIADVEAVAADTAPGARALGHELMHHLYRSEGVNPENVGDDKLWKIVDADGDNDSLALNDTKLLEATLNLQVLVRTNLTLNMRAGSNPPYATTNESGGADYVHVIFNVIFDRDAEESAITLYDAATGASAAVVDPGSDFTMTAGGALMSADE